MNLLKQTETDMKSLLLESERIKLEYHNFIADEEKKHKKLLLNVLEIVDSLEEKILAAETDETLTEEAKNCVDKFKIPLKKLLKLLTEENVVSIETTIGEPFNPVWHQPVDTMKKIGAAENSIGEIQKKGYLFKGKLLRNSIVVVVKNN